MAHADSNGSKKRHPKRGEQAPEGEANYVVPRGSDVPNPDSAQFKGGGVSGGIHQKHPDISDSRGWAVEPNVGRMANGVPSRVDRLKCIGNAVVPQVARQIGELIINVQDIQGRIADN
jgi:DNA (cytosine-5)-methyltransferase 1